jgi:hypothetical protein
MGSSTDRTLNGFINTPPGEPIIMPDSRPDSARVEELVAIKMAERRQNATVNSLSLRLSFILSIPIPV